ncbi:MAG: tetratricopeptide repeat protein [Bacteroidetes bacterium]|nr:tetratricopeptide repeat protein [Bacteroidota bacterium]
MKRQFYLLFILLLVMASCQEEKAGDFINAGLEKMNAKDFQGALADFTKATEVEPSSAPAFYNKANMEGQLGKLDEALADFNQCIKLDSTFAEAYTNRAYFIWTPRGDFENAIRDYNTAIRMKKVNVLAYTYNNRASARLMLNDGEGALMDANHSISLDSTNPLAYLNRARALILTGKTESVCKDLQKAKNLKISDVSKMNIDSLIAVHCVPVTK